MGLDTSKSKTSPEELKANARAKVDGKKNRQAFIDELTDLITREDSPVDSVTLTELRHCWIHFPLGKDLVDRIERLYSDKKQAEVKKAVLLSAILACLECLLYTSLHSSDVSRTP